jgi:hypothetical protein
MMITNQLGWFQVNLTLPLDLLARGGNLVFELVIQILLRNYAYATLALVGLTNSIVWLHWHKNPLLRLEDNIFLNYSANYNHGPVARHILNAFKIAIKFSLEMHRQTYTKHVRYSCIFASFRDDCGETGTAHSSFCPITRLWNPSSYIYNGFNSEVRNLFAGGL